MFYILDRKSKKDPKKILDDLQQQEEKLKKIAETDSNKAKELKEKMAWKNILQKAEGEKDKDDPTLLKKSIKKMVNKYFKLICNIIFKSTLIFFHLYQSRWHLLLFPTRLPKFDTLYVEREGELNQYNDLFIRV